MLKQKQPRFNTVLTEAVHEGLDSIGPSITDAVLFYMKKKAAIQLDRHDLDPVVFDGCLKGLFGWGAEIVEKKILECLYLKLEVRIKIGSGFVFADEVKKARKFLDSSDLLIAQPAGEPENNRKSTRKPLLVNNKGQTL
jgi:hypothetical protein